MQIKRPKFMDSPYFIAEAGNWHLTKDAPEEIKKEFEEYMSLFLNDDLQEID